MPKIKKYFSFERVPSAIGELDGMRATAMMLVFLFHSVIGFWAPDQPLLPVLGWDLANPAYNTFYALEMFFVLSGFLIFGRLIRHLEVEGDTVKKLLAYLRDRILRVVPAYYLLVFLMYCGVMDSFYPSATEDLVHSVVTHLAYLQDYLSADLNPSYWAMAVEFKFYLTAPLLVLFVFKTKLRKYRYHIFVFLFFVPLFFRYITPVSVDDFVIFSGYRLNIFRTPFHLYYDSFIAGGVCYMLYQDRHKLSWLQANQAGQIFLYSGVLILLPYILRPVPYGYLDSAGNIVSGYNQVITLTVTNLAIAALYMGILCGAGYKSYLNSKFCLIMAQISYSFYLVHIPMLWLSYGCVSYIYEGILGLSLLDLSYAARWLCVLVLGFSFSYAAALLLHFSVEKPFLLLKNRHRQKPA